MAFGQPAGPPASARQVQELLGLLQDAGHLDFRDARGPMGFSQRQAAGKFTRDEAAALIDLLQAPPGQERPPASPGRLSPPGSPPAPFQHALHRVPTEQLVAELRRRGWEVHEP